MISLRRFLIASIKPLEETSQNIFYMWIRWYFYLSFIFKNSTHCHYLGLFLRLGFQEGLVTQAQARFTRTVDTRETSAQSNLGVS